MVTNDNSNDNDNNHRFFGGGGGREGSAVTTNISNIDERARWWLQIEFSSDIIKIL